MDGGFVNWVIQVTNQGLQIGLDCTNWDKSGTWNKMNRKLIFKKRPRFVPIHDNLTQFDAKSANPVTKMAATKYVETSQI